MNGKRITVAGLSLSPSFSFSLSPSHTLHEKMKTKKGKISANKGFRV